MNFPNPQNIFHLTTYYKFFIILFVATSYSSNAQQKQFIPQNTQNPFKVKKLNSNPNSILTPKLSVKKSNQKKAINVNQAEELKRQKEINQLLAKENNKLRKLILDNKFRMFGASIF